MRLMGEFSYDKHTTPDELAVEWDIEPQTVRNYASEASRRLRAFVHDDDDLRESVKFALVEIVRECRTRKKPYLETAVKALSVLTGIIAVKKGSAPDGDGPARFIVHLTDEAPPVATSPHTDVERLDLQAEPQA